MKMNISKCVQRSLTSKEMRYEILSNLIFIEIFILKLEFFFKISYLLE